MDYIKKFLQVVQSLDHDNTYKLAFARAVLECIEDGEIEDHGDHFVLYQYSVAQKVIRYYWNLIGFFQLSQGPSSVLESRIKEIHDEYYSHTTVTYPVWYDKVETYLQRIPMRFERQVKKFITLFTKNVAGKFKVSRNDKLELFELDLKLKLLRFNTEHIALLQKNKDMLHNVIDFEWAKLLEEYNKSPNIIKKVIGSKDSKIKRQNLVKYRNVLLQYSHFEGVTDFYTGEHLEVNDISLEHAIPFHFIYGCDIWNLIVVSKDTAKQHRGRIPTQEDIDKVQKRNEQLLDALQDTKLYARFELEKAQNNHLLQRYYIDLKG